MSADRIRELTYYLCYSYSRCERTVGYPAPTYYEHLTAFRSRELHNTLVANTESKVADEVRKKALQKKENNTLNELFCMKG